MSPKYFKKFRISICNQVWTIFYISSRSFVMHFGDCKAITTYSDDERYIYFHPADTTLSTIAHELTHAYLSSKIKPKMGKLQVEELFCDLLPRSARTILRRAKKLQKRLRRR